MMGVILKESRRRRDTSRPFPEPNRDEPSPPKTARPPKRSDDQRDGEGLFRIPSGGGYRILRRPRLLDGED